jgi:hypothetical protein
MLNRRKKQIMDPKRINNYNKLLSTLDQTPCVLNNLSYNLDKIYDLKNDDDANKKNIDTSLCQKFDLIGKHDYLDSKKSDKAEI